MLALEARDDLRFGLDFQLAKLFALTADGLFELDKVKAECRYLLFKT